MRSLALLAIVLAACGRSGGSACERRAAALGDSLAAAAREGESLIANSTHLLELRDAPLARRDGAPIVEVLATGIITVNGVHAFDAREVMDALAATDARPPRVLLGIEAGAPMDQVANAERGAVAAGFTDAGVLFTRPTALVRPPPSMILSEIHGIARARDSGMKAAAFARVGVRTFHGCKELEHAFADVSRGHGGDELIAAIPGALTACDCSIDLDNFHDLMWMILAPLDHAPQTVVDVTLAPAEDHGALAIIGATWADAAPSLIAAKGTRIRFATR